MTDHAASLTTAAGDLAWFKIPHKLTDCCRVARDLAANDARIAGGYRAVQRDIRRNHHPEEITADAYIRIDYADPTGDAVAAMSRTDHAETEHTMIAALTTIEAATHLALRYLTDATGKPRPTDPPTQLDERVSHAEINIRQITWLIDARALLDGVDLTSFDIEVRDGICDTTRFLRTTAESLWRDAPADAQRPAVQVARVCCISCIRYAGASGRPREVDVDPEYRDCCTRCGRYRKEHRHLPDEPIIRGWDYGKQPGMVDHMRAKAASRAKLKVQATG